MDLWHRVGSGGHFGLEKAGVPLVLLSTWRGAARLSTSAALPSSQGVFWRPRSSAEGCFPLLGHILADQGDMRVLYMFMSNGTWCRQGMQCLIGVGTAPFQQWVAREVEDLHARLELDMRAALQQNLNAAAASEDCSSYAMYPPRMQPDPRMHDSAAAQPIWPQQSHLRHKKELEAAVVYIQMLNYIIDEGLKLFLSCIDYHGIIQA